MWVISKKKALFQQDSPVDPKDQKAAENAEPPFVLEPNVGDLALEPVFAPDWIKETEFYKLLKKEGSIRESADGPTEKTEESDEKAHKSQPKTGLPAWKK